MTDMYQTDSRIVRGLAAGAACAFLLAAGAGFRCADSNPARPGEAHL